MRMVKSFIFPLLGITFSMACAGPGGRQVQETNDQLLIEVFYKEMPPSLQTLERVRFFLEDYQASYRIEFLEMTDAENEERMTSLGYPDEHFPFGLAIDGKTSAEIDGEIIVFGNFPDFMHHIGRHQGNWTLDHLTRVLQKPRLLREKNPKLVNQPGGQGGANRLLPEPERRGGMPLMEALDKRQSMRDFSPEALSDQDLSNLLWAAWGINRADGRRTAPTARNRQQFDIYLIMADGWYLYDPQRHALIRQGDEDLRAYSGTQAFVQTAPLNLVFVSDHERMTGYDAARREFYSATDVGFISQNVYLYCASAGLATVVRGALDREILHDVLKLGPSQHVILGQSVGYPAQEN